MDILTENADKPIFTPPYYHQFRCLAGRCRHNCCVGWEIGIDGDTLARYRREPGALGDKLRANIADVPDGASFILRKDGRCPFLTEDNLCELILRGGEDALCRICRDHPRFINEYDDRLEVGLGMCCEAAAGLILRQPDPPEGPGAETPVDPDALLALERLDGSWTECLTDLKQYLSEGRRVSLPEDGFWRNAFGNLYGYVMFRYGSEALADYVCSLVRLCCEARLRRNGTVAPEDMIDVCRMYSAEIEYSDENLALLEQLLGV